jgi:hypothetical protein
MKRLVRRSSHVCLESDGGDALRQVPKSGAVPAELLVDVLHRFLATLVLEVDINVGRLAPLDGDEAFEEQVHAFGIESYRRARGPPSS